MATGSSRVTIGTIAKLAGVSVMTVSRILNDRPDVSSETRERVLKVMQEHHYQPHGLARKLSGKQSHIVGLALYSRGNPFAGLYLEVLQGVQSALAVRSYDIMLLAPSESDHYGYRVAQTSLLDGVVLMGLLAEADDVSLFQQGTTPFITIGRRQAGAIIPSFVAPDYRHAFENAVGYLARQHRTCTTALIANLHQAEQFASVADRLQGIEAGMAAQGIDASALELVESDRGFEAGYRWGLDTPLRESLILDSTEFSFGVAVGLRERGVHIPDDLAVVGMDYDQGIIQKCANVLGSAIPAWSISWHKIGEDAVTALLAQIEGTSKGGTAKYVDFDFKSIDRW